MAILLRGSVAREPSPSEPGDNEDGKRGRRPVMYARNHVFPMPIFVVFLVAQICFKW
jgi:hypothetical protein